MSQFLQRSSLWREQAFVAGQWVEADSWIDVVNPANGNQIGRVPSLGADHVRQAITAADMVRHEWASRPARERGLILRRIADLMIGQQDALAALITTEQGKPLAEAREEVRYAASFFEWFGEEARRINGEILAPHRSDRRLFVLRQPIGVCAAITPWNFPAAMVTRKVAPALAAGCAMVLKPSELTPFTALAICALAEEAGVPAGLLSCVTGDPQAIGAELTGNERVRKLSFTGSTAVGRLLMEACAANISKVSLELGGNAPFLVFEDADLDAAVAGAIASKFRNAGQTCVCANRFYVAQPVYEAFCAKMKRAVAALVTRPGDADQVMIGPLINEAAVSKVERHVKDAVARGGRVLTGGQRTSANNRVFEPTLIIDVPADAVMFQEETFGPVAGVTPFADEAEAIRLANASESGLAAYFYTNNHSRFIRVSEALNVGIVGHNTGMVSTEVAPFGGVKQSGIGREGSHHGIEDYLELKYVCSAIEQGSLDPKQASSAA